MNVGLAVAGVICVLMAFGHGTIGYRWLLPGLDKENLPKTPFGSRSTSLSMIRVTWHVVTLFALGLGGLLISLAFAPVADPRTLLLRWFAAIWLAATAMAFWIARPRPRQLLRLPVPLLWIVVAVLLWIASI